MKYNYSELEEKALAYNATQEDINNLGEWFNRYGGMYWNGSFFAVKDDIRLYPIYKGYKDGRIETIGYTFDIKESIIIEED